MKNLQHVKSESAGLDFCTPLADFLHYLCIPGEHLLAFQSAGNQSGVIVFLGLGLTLLLKFVEELAKFDRPVLELLDLALRL